MHGEEFPGDLTGALSQYLHEGVFNPHYSPAHGGVDFAPGIALHPGAAGPHTDTAGNTNRPADLMHAQGGSDPAAAQLWAQHHPGAISRGQIPPWVARILARRINAMRNAGHGPGGPVPIPGYPAE